MLRKAVEGTPFSIVGNEEQGYMVTLGRFQITERRRTVEELEELIANRDYKLLLSMMGAAYQYCQLEMEEKNAKEQDSLINN